MIDYLFDRSLPVVVTRKVAGFRFRESRVRGGGAQGPSF